MTQEYLEQLLAKGFEDEKDLKKFMDQLDAADFPLFVELAHPAYPKAVRQSAIWFLGELKIEPALPFLLNSITEADADLRFQILHALKHFPHPDVLTAARGCLNDKEPSVRHEAVRVLAEIGTVEDVAHIQKMCDETNIENVRAIYAAALQRLKDRLSV